MPAVSSKRKTFSLASRHGRLKAMANGITHTPLSCVVLFRLDIIIIIVITIHIYDGTTAARDKRHYFPSERVTNGVLLVVVAANRINTRIRIVARSRWIHGILKWYYFIHNVKTIATKHIRFAILNRRLITLLFSKSLQTSYC